MKKSLIAFLLLIPLIAGAKSFVVKVGEIYFLVMPHNNRCWVTDVPEGYPEYSVDITVPEGVKIDQTSAFIGRSALQKVYLPSTITDMEPDSFGEYSELGLVRCDALNAPQATNAFTKIKIDRIQLIVPSSAKQSYKASPVLKKIFFAK